MKGEIVQNIFIPEKDAEWVLIKTNKNLYSMRLGGFKTVKEISDNHKEIEFPYKNGIIEEVYTDEEWVYVILIGGGVIASGWVDITLDGDLTLGIQFTDLTKYEPNSFQSRFFSKLTVGTDGWSKSI